MLILDQQKLRICEKLSYPVITSQSLARIISGFVSGNIIKKFLQVQGGGVDNERKNHDRVML